MLFIINVTLNHYTIINNNALHLHLRKMSDGNIVSDIRARFGFRINPPWLNTRSTGALDSGTGTLSALIMLNGTVY